MELAKRAPAPWMFVFALAGTVGLLQAESPCATCVAMTPLVNEQTTTIATDWSPGTLRSCDLLDTVGQWNNFCKKNGLTSCPDLGREFFKTHTVAAVSFDAISPVFCDQVGADPGYETTCITADAFAVQPRIAETSSFGCACTRNPQFPVTVFIADAIGKTDADVCNACIESHSVGCLRLF